jgi:hypothetical protein
VTTLEVGNIQGLDIVIRELNNFEPGAVKTMRKEIITEIRPLYASIKSSIPRVAPLSGFDNQGRTGWPKRNVKVTGKTNFRSRAGKHSLVSIRTASAAVQIVDISGRKGKGRTESGQAMIANLSSRFGKASRFVYPAVEKEIPRVQNIIKKILDRYANMVNRKFF